MTAAPPLADTPSEAQAPTPLSALAPDAAVLDAQALAQLHQLDPQGHSGIVRRVLQTYQRSLERFVADVDHARAAADHPALARLTHTLRSSSASVGAMQLSVLCKRIETGIRGQQLDELPVLLDALRLESGRVQTALAAMLVDLGHAPPTAP
ncbi:MAG: Hpt domain-containing protein [Rubrivivax sp.]|jgi:HPt (histidine-containing phosphotransfer) domain-containing protein